MTLVKTTKIGKQKVSVYQPKASGTFRQWFCEALNVKDSNLDETLKKHCFTEKQIDLVIETQNKKDIGLCTDGWTNFFPVLNSDGSVSVLDVFRYGGGWDRGVDDLGDGRVWNADDRVVLSNSDASTLSDTLSLETLTARVERLEKLFNPELLV
jgi:hypothetical protein